MLGKFIVFEGGEGSGKTTQIKLLQQKLETAGFSVLTTREPGGTNCPIAEKIRQLLKDPTNKEMKPAAEFFLFLASRNQHVEQIVKPAVSAGQIVISDRYFGSSFAYQHFGRGLFDLQTMKNINALAINGAVPDLTILLDIEPTSGLTRVESGANRNNLKDDRFDAEQLEFHEKVRNGYLTLAKTEPNWQVFDANQPPEKLHEQIWAQVQKML